MLRWKGRRRDASSWRLLVRVGARTLVGRVVELSLSVAVAFPLPFSLALGGISNEWLVQGQPPNFNFNRVTHTFR